MEAFKRKKIVQNSLFFFVFFLWVLFSISCKKNHLLNRINDKKTHYFFGDSTMSQSNYFNLVTGENGYTILKKQNKLYQQKYFDSEKGNLPEIKKGNLTIRLLKMKSSDKNSKVILYTFKDDKKIDSLQFYRSSDNIRYPSDVYTCLSHFDIKTNKIRQVRYFSYDKDRQWDIVSYKQSTILPNGNIKKDSLYYLDESLEVEMEKHHLYY